MAFGSASGYSNLPNGNFSPVIYSQKVQKSFRNSSVVEDITNTDYMGEIANFGDSVRIIKEPEITVSSYLRGTSVTAQDLSDADFSLVVDQVNYFMFKIDDTKRPTATLTSWILLLIVQLSVCVTRLMLKFSAILLVGKRTTLALDSSYCSKWL